MMYRKDQLLQDFLKHEYLLEKYDVTPEDIPEKFNDCLSSDIPIVKIMAYIIKEIEQNKTPEKSLHSSLRSLIQTFSIE